MHWYRKVLVMAGSFASLNAGNAQAAPASSPCPAAPLPPAMGNLPPIPMATSIRPSDTSTSIVIRPDPANQITCGRTVLTATPNVVFAQVAGPAGRTRPLALDLLAPAQPGSYPLVVYITGGGFVMAAKENGLNLRTFVAENGFVVASIQYRTALDGAHFRDGIADVKSAIRFLRAHAAEYHIDPSHVAVWGESAGGYLAAMVGMTNGVKAFDQGGNLDQRSDVTAVIDKFGTTDTQNAAEDFNPEMAAMVSPISPIGHYMSENGASFPPASNPLTYIGPSTPPFLLFSGSHDRIVSPSQTLRLHTALRAAGVSSTRYVLDGADHGDLAFTGDMTAGLPWSSRQTMEIIVHFLQNPK